MEENELDQFLRTALQSNEIPIQTPMKEVEKSIYEKVARLREQERQRKRRLYQIVAGIILLLGLSGTILFPQTAIAIKDKLIILLSWSKNEAQINTRSIALTNKVDDCLVNELTKLQPEVPYKIKIPKYIPNGFVYKQVTVNKKGSVARVTIEYEQADKRLRITQENLPGEVNYSLRVNTASGQIKSINVNNTEGTLISFNNGLNQILWTANEGVRFTVDGIVPPDELLSIANFLE